MVVLKGLLSEAAMKRRPRNTAVEESFTTGVDIKDATGEKQVTVA